MSLAAVLGRAASRVPAGHVLVAGSGVLLAVRLALSLARSGPVVMADEAGYLMHARVLAGGMPAEMGFSPFYRGGYSLLLAPVLSADSDPVAAYHGVLVVNTLLAASVVALLYLLLTRCFGVGPQLAAWAAVAGGAYPTITALTQVARSENLLFPLALAWLLAAGGVLRGGARGPLAGWAVTAGVCAAALWTAHGRMIVVAGLTVALLLAVPAVRRRRADVVAAGAGLAALAAGVIAGRRLNDWLLARNYSGPRLDETERALSSLGDADATGTVLANLAGQGWYVLVATLGVVALLLARDVPVAVARLARRRAEPADALLALLVLTTAGLLLASALWFPVRERADQLIYGRYVEPLAPALVAVGIAMLARPGSRVRLRPLALGVAGLTLLVAGLRAGLELPLEPSRWNVASLPAPTGQLDAPIVVAAGAVALAAMWLLSRVARDGPAALGAVVLVLFVPTTAYLAYLPVLRSERDVYPPGWTSPRPLAEERGATRVGYDDDHFDHIAVKTYQWAMPDTRFVPFAGGEEAPPAALFFSAKRLSGRLAALPATRLWSDPGRDQALWRLAP